MSMRKLLLLIAAIFGTMAVNATITEEELTALNCKIDLINGSPTKSGGKLTCTASTSNGKITLSTTGFCEVSEYATVSLIIDPETGDVTMSPQTLVALDEDTYETVYYLIVPAEDKDKSPMEVSTSRVTGKYENGKITLSAWNAIKTSSSFSENLGNLYPNDVTSIIATTNASVSLGTWESDYDWNTWEFKGWIKHDMGDVTKNAYAEVNDGVLTIYNFDELQGALQFNMNSNSLSANPDFVSYTRQRQNAKTYKAKSIPAEMTEEYYDFLSDPVGGKLTDKNNFEVYNFAIVSDDGDISGSEYYQVNVTTDFDLPYSEEEPEPQGPKVIRVKTDGTGNGSSWDNAMGDLQAAIDAANAGDEIWIAAGTYKPVNLIRNNKPTSRAFILKDGVSLYGGFAGTENSRDERVKSGDEAWAYANATVLSGDDDQPDTWNRQIDPTTSYRWTWELDGNEVPGTSGNASHVLYCADVISNLTVIEGLTLTAGNANVWQAKAHGGGLYALGNVQLKNSQVTNCASYFKAESSSDNNSYGGAVFLNGAGDAAIEGCRFAENYCHSSYGNGIGGAVYARNAAISDCLFEDCVADDAGGGLYNDKGSVVNTTFLRCYAGSGGAIYNDGTAQNITIRDSRGLLGGGLYNLGDARYFEISGCYADAPEYGESMGGRGGGALVAEGQLVGSVVYNNQAFWGGGAYSIDGRIINSTLQNNMLRMESDTANVGIKNHDQMMAQILNTIGNQATSASDFVNPTTFKGVPTTDAERAALLEASWQLSAVSQFIDAGTLTEGIEEETDIAGNPRVAGNSIDVGAYEFAGEPLSSNMLTITFDESTTQATIGVGGRAGDKFFIDWGDGELKEYTQLNYYTGDITGGTVKVWGNITGLYAPEQNITGLDLANCSTLKVLDVHVNNIAGDINLSAMTELSRVDVADNNITSLELPSTSALIDLDCANNSIAELNLAGLVNLDELMCYDNQIASLDVTDCTQLKNINAANNNLTEIDLSNCTLLEGVYLYDNQLQSINFGDIASVRWLNVENNSLSELPTSKFAQLSLVIANNNQISSVDFAQNPSLSQIKLANNNLSAIDVSNQPYLSWLKIDGNNIGALDVTNNNYLYWLECGDNKIPELDLHNNTYLQWLAAENNLLTTLDVSVNTGLQGLTLQGNNMSVDVINTIIDQLQDVNNVEITDYNRAWGRQFNISFMPGTTDANIAEAEAKGWFVTAEQDIAIAIDSVAAEGNTAVRYFGIDGKAYSERPAKQGLYIMQSIGSNGKKTTRKVMIK